MLIYVMSSPDSEKLILTGSLAAVVAARKGAELEGVVLEVGTWDTDRSSICTITLNFERGNDQPVEETVHTPTE
jgi:hypothetical protein